MIVPMVMIKALESKTQMDAKKPIKEVFKMSIDDKVPLTVLDNSRERERPNDKKCSVMSCALCLLPRSPL